MSYLNINKHRVTLDGFVNKVAKQPVNHTTALASITRCFITAYESELRESLQR